MSPRHVTHCIQFLFIVDLCIIRRVRINHYSSFSSRYYIRKDGLCAMRMVDAEFEYTYEYQGNAPKLVHTPLTDKCYLTLTQGRYGSTDCGGVG